MVFRVCITEMDFVAYMLKKPEDQAAFYHLVAKLLWFLASGKSHVGYLHNCPENPFAMKSVPISKFCC